MRNNTNKVNYTLMPPANGKVEKYYLSKVQVAVLTAIGLPEESNY